VRGQKTTVQAAFEAEALPAAVRAADERVLADRVNIHRAGFAVQRDAELVVAPRIARPAYYAERVARELDGHRVHQVQRQAVVRHQRVHPLDAQVRQEEQQAQEMRHLEVTMPAAEQLGPVVVFARAVQPERRLDGWPVRADMPAEEVAHVGCEGAVDVLDRAQLARVQHRLELLDERQMRVRVADRQFPALRLGQFDEMPRIARMEGHRLLDEHMPPRQQAVSHDLVVRRVRGDDDDRVDICLVQHGAVVGIELRRRRRTGLGRHPVERGLGFVGPRIAERDELRIRVGQQGRDVRVRRPPARADNSDAYFVGCAYHRRCPRSL